MSRERRAAFLDRDGTLIEDAQYLSEPQRMRLMPGAAEAVRRLNDAGILAVVVTNQSGIALGFLTEEQYHATRARLVELLAAAGARIDATYHCPHHPGVSGVCDCRKPGTGMYRRAAADHDIDLGRSVYVGDRYRDVAPGLELGGTAWLVPSGESPPEEVERAERESLVAPSLLDAIEWYLASQQR